MNIVPASQNNFSTAIRLLQSCGLPTADLNPGTQLFVLEDGNEVIGTIAVEYDFNSALLRSLSVPEERRKEGIGTRLVGFIEDYVRKQGVQNIYLLTTSADSFFRTKGYNVIGRDSAPDFIKSTSEFTTVCSSTSTLMTKQLA